MLYGNCEKQKHRKSQMFLSGIKVSKMVARTWKMINEVVVQNLTEPMKMIKKLRNLLHSDRRLSMRIIYSVCFVDLD
jgi:hypothetical protein